MPACTSTVHASIFPLYAAQCKGVQPNKENIQHHHFIAKLNNSLPIQHLYVDCAQYVSWNVFKGILIIQENHH